jgi:hypothetical protein
MTASRLMLYKIRMSVVVLEIQLLTFQPVYLWIKTQSLRKALE